jgi:hypothetical protein
MPASPSIPRDLAWTAVFWLAAALARSLFFHEINAKLWILSLLLDGIMVIGGIWIALALALRLKRFGSKAVWLALAIVAVGLGIWATPGGRDLGMVFRLFRLEGQYEEAIRQIRSGGDTKSLGFDTAVAKGGNEVAFSWGGILDNWHGIVHDPDGSVLAVNRYDWRDPNAPKPDGDVEKVRLLFGGVMTSARHLWGDWYYCTFT